MRPVIFLNTGWMEKYDGPADIVGGGRYVKETGIGWEIFNFKNFNGKAYGYSQPSGEKNSIERLGAAKDADSISGVLAVFTATDPLYGGIRVTGWYKNATFYRDYQDVKIPGRKAHGKVMGYYVEADFTDAVLLTPDERRGFIELPSRLPAGSGWRGRSNVFYADFGEGLKLKNRIVARIDDYKTSEGRSKKPYSRKPPSPEFRKAVENASMDCISQYYEDRGYDVSDVHRDKVGWDLEARSGNHVILIEVKGFSGREISADLTANEFSKMKKYKSRGYRLAAVTNALSDPTPYIFEFSLEKNKWIDLHNDLTLIIDKSIVARCTVK